MIYRLMKLIKNKMKSYNNLILYKINKVYNNVSKNLKKENRKNTNITNTYACNKKRLVSLKNSKITCV